METNTKQIAAAAMGALALGAGAGFVLDQPEPVVVEKEVIKNVTVEVPVPGPTVEVPVEVIKQVYVDNGKLADVLEAIYQADGDLEFVTDDLKESEIAEIADRLVFEMDVQELARAAVVDEARDLLHKEELGAVKFDEDDIERIKVQDDRGEIEVLDRDFEDGDADVKVTVHFEQDDVKYAADFIVLVKEGKVDEVEVDSIYLR